MTPDRAPLEVERRTRISDETIIAEIRRIAAMVEGPIYRAKLFNAKARACGSLIYQRFGSWHAALERAGLAHMSAVRHEGPRRRRQTSYWRLTDAEMLDHLRRVAREKGSDELCCGDLARYHAPNPGTYARHFGSWRVAAAKAGLSDRPWQTRYTAAECIDNMRRVWMHLGRQPREIELEFAPSTIGPSAYLKQWRTWTGALEAFVSHVNADRADPLWAAVRPLVGRVWAKPPPAIGEKRAPPIALRYQVLRRDRYRCVLCGASPATDPQCELQIDHIQPFALGGPTVADNLRTLCKPCNMGRGFVGGASGTVERA